MVLSVTDMWNDLKSDIGINLKILINDDNKEKELKEVFTLMLSMLGTTKIKQPYNEVNYDRKTSLET
jgi:hypothetical protein